MIKYVVGQRWTSEPEPELGLGLVVETNKDRVTVDFRAVQQRRTYSIDNAPLRRYKLRPGDIATSTSGSSFQIAYIHEHSGLIVYQSDQSACVESELADQSVARGPQERIASCDFDNSTVFDLRNRCRNQLHQSQSSLARGFTGARIDLIPHQLSIAQEVASRQFPRVLLSDAVGLGKTIEAGLILQRLIATGRVLRVLILVPEPLVHQWLAELARRFNLWPKIYNEDRCLGAESSDPDGNPFSDEQFVLSTTQCLTDNPKRGLQAVQAGWDLLLVDEAHHLEWSEQNSSPAYTVVESLSRAVPSLILITATPEQLGLESHFARLRLLDPDRFPSLEMFRQEPRNFGKIADWIEQLRENKPISEIVGLSEALRASFDNGADSQVSHDSKLLHRPTIIEHLLDLHGPGRVIFRNTRTTVPGFPKRHAHLHELKALDDGIDWLDLLTTECAVDFGDKDLQPPPIQSKDPRLRWLSAFLTQCAPDKVLLICRSAEKVKQIETQLRLLTHCQLAVFHEELSLTQRDRNAAWFTDHTDGARILICSEIGGEGRNFQCANHLVLFDLPLNPEQLEQRIGRLDRIGQKRPVEIHIPFLRRSPQSILARWFHEGLNALEIPLEGGLEIRKLFENQVQEIALEYSIADPEEADSEIQSLIESTKVQAQEIRTRLADGRDRLLEWSSHRPEKAQHLAKAILEEDASATLESLMLDIFESFGVRQEWIGNRTYKLDPSGVSTEAFPAMPIDGVGVTFDRAKALIREELGFLTWDHPMVTGAMELILGSSLGNCCFTLFNQANLPQVVVETIFVLEPMAIERWHPQRFLPPTPLRIIIDAGGENITTAWPPPKQTAQGSMSKLPHILDNDRFREELIPNLLEHATQAAEVQSNQLKHQALMAMREKLSHEMNRLRSLAKRNNLVRSEEFGALDQEQHALEKILSSASLRLDAVRIWLNSKG